MKQAPLGYWGWGQGERDKMQAKISHEYRCKSPLESESTNK